MWKQWKTIGLIAAVLAIGSFSGAYAQRGGGGGHGGGGGGGGHGGGGFGGGGGGHVGGGGFGGGGFGGGGGHVGGGNFGGGGGGVRVGGGGVNIGSGGGIRVGGAPGVGIGAGSAARVGVGTPNIGARVGGNVGTNFGNAARIGVGANTNAGAQFHNLNNAINQAGRIGVGTNAGLNLNNRTGANLGLNNRLGVGVGLGNNLNGRYSAGYRPYGNSFFFGVGSPFNNYYGSSFYRNAYGYRGPIYGYYGYNRPFIGLGLGYPFGYGLGYGNYGYGGYGGYGGGYGYSPYFGYQSVSTYQPVYVAADGSVPTDQPQPPATDTTAQAQTGGADFAVSGEQNFKAGKYNEAIRDWQHALVDEPRNGAYIMLLSQAFFATGKFNEAAGAVQAGTQLLPDKDWGIVIQHYKELYANQGDYTNQLRALEKARNDKQDDPALRFLLGWHYNYLGFAPQGLREIDKALELAPKDEITAKVRDVFAKTPPAPQAAAR